MRAQITGAVIQYGDPQTTRVSVDLYEDLGGGIERNTETFHLAFDGALSEAPQQTAAVAEKLASINITATVTPL